MPKSIAIDGPVGAGKSTIAKKAAAALGFIYIDTGAMYRAIGYYVLRCGIDINSVEAVSKATDEINLEIKPDAGQQYVYLNGENVNGAIRTPEVSMAASKVSAVPYVREFLLELQRSFAENNNVIMDGRDIGTVVLPGADLKIYLTADPNERAQRRFDELTAKGMNVKFEDILSDLNKRDYDDMNRKTAPLKQAKDAILIDTTGINLEESVELVINEIKKIIQVADDKG